MGESTFSMNYEFAVLGIGVNLQLSGGESFPMIEDEPVEKEAVEKKKNFFEEFVENIKPSGLVVSAIFGAIGVIAAVVAAPLTGAAAVIGGAIAIGATVAAAATEVYTYGTALVDTITGHETEDEVFLENVLTIGATTFVLVSGMAAIAGLAAVGGSGGGSLAVAGGGTMALEGGLIIGAEGAIAGAIEVIIGGTLTGAIAVAASMQGNEGKNRTDSNKGESNKKSDYDDIQGIISKIPKGLKTMGKCDQFAMEFVRRLKNAGIVYEIIRIDTKTGYIYSDRLRNSIGKAYHYGVKIGNMVYDNLTTNGMDFRNWLVDLGADGSFADVTWKIVDKILNY